MNENEIKESFDIFDKMSNGYLEPSSAKELISCFGENIDDDVLNSLTQGSNVPYDNIKNYILDKSKNKKKNNIREDFNNLLNKKGKLTAIKFKNFLMNFGEKLSEKEANDIIDKFNKDNEGNIDYDKLLSDMGY